MPGEAIKDFMTPSPHTIRNDQPLGAARQLMREHGIRHLPVLQEGRLVGILSERDLHLLETMTDLDLLRIPVEDAMTQEVFAVGPDEPLARVIERMSRQKIGSAVVVEGRDVVGVFTTIDALRVLRRMLEEHGIERRADTVH